MRLGLRRNNFQQQFTKLACPWPHLNATELQGWIINIIVNNYYYVSPCCLWFRSWKGLWSRIARRKSPRLCTHHRLTTCTCSTGLTRWLLQLHLPGENPFDLRAQRAEMETGVGVVGKWLPPQQTSTVARYILSTHQGELSKLQPCGAGEMAQ